VTRGTAQNSPENITAAFIAGCDAVADEKSNRAAVIGNDADGDVVVRVLSVGFFGYFFHETDDRREQVRLIVAFLALDDGGQPLQSHARVNVGFGKRRQFARFVAVELGKNKIPDFQMTVAVTVNVAIRAAAAGAFALIVNDFGTRAAGAGFAHHPEIAFLAHAHDAVCGHIHFLIPDFKRFVVVFEMVIQSFSLGSPTTSMRYSHAHAMASSLK